MRRPAQHGDEFESVENYDQVVRQITERPGITAAERDDRLTAFERIILVLDESLIPRDVAQWLRTSNRLLSGERPLDVLVNGVAAAAVEAAIAVAERLGTSGRPDQPSGG